jgi:hypothetical protein
LARISSINLLAAVDTLEVAEVVPAAESGLVALAQAAVASLAAEVFDWVALDPVAVQAAFIWAEFV